MTAAAFTFTPNADFVDRALDAKLRRDSESVDRKLRTMLAVLDDALAGISDAREELHTLYAAPTRKPLETLRLSTRISRPVFPCPR